MGIPVLGFAGFSGSGKTTLMEGLIPHLRARGLRLAVVKHDGHRFELDRPGKDSARFARAGAEMVVLTSREKTAVIEQRRLELEDALRFVHDVDLILVEGYKQAGITQVGIARKENQKGFTAELGHFWRIVTDLDIPNAYGFEDTAALAADIAAHLEEFSQF